MLGFTSTSLPLGMAAVISSSNPARIGKSASAAPCTIMGFTQLNTSASGIMPRDVISLSIQAEATPPLGCIQNQYFADVGLASQFMSGAREYTGDAVKVVTRGKAVLRHECGTAYGTPHRLARAENYGCHDHVNLPDIAASTHSSIEANIG